MKGSAIREIYHQHDGRNRVCMKQRICKKGWKVKSNDTNLHMQIS